MWLELRQLQCFLALVEHGTLARAGATLQFSPPAMSELITRLEREVGTQLFYRMASGHMPTTAGRELEPRARQILRDLETARSAVAHAAGSVAGHLDIGTGPGYHGGAVAPLMGELRRQYPEVSVRVVESSEAALLAGVADGKFELAFTTVPSGGRRNFDILADGMTVYDMDECEIVLVLPPASAGELPERISLHDLPDLPLISAVGEGVHNGAAEWHLPRSGPQARPAVITAHGHATLPLVLAGVGMAWAHEMEVQEAVALGCETRRLDPPFRVSSLVAHRAGVLAPAADYLLRCATTTLRTGASGTSGSEGWSAE